MPKIEMFLVLSTNHISQKTHDWLRKQSNKVDDAAYHKGPHPEIHCGAHVYGWWVFCDQEPGENVPADLKECIAFAVKQRIHFINFDADEPEIEELETYHA